MIDHHKWSGFFDRSKEESAIGQLESSHNAAQYNDGDNGDDNHNDNNENAWNGVSWQPVKVQELWAEEVAWPVFYLTRKNQHLGVLSRSRKSR